MVKIFKNILLTICSILIMDVAAMDYPKLQIFNSKQLNWQFVNFLNSNNTINLKNYQVIIIRFSDIQNKDNFSFSANFTCIEDVANNYWILKDCVIIVPTNKVTLYNISLGKAYFDELINTDSLIYESSIDFDNFYLNFSKQSYTISYYFKVVNGKLFQDYSNCFDCHIPRLINLSRQFPYQKKKNRG